MGPQIAIYDATNSALVSNWDIGVLKAQIPSDILTINVWNNKGGTTDVSDLKEAYIMVLDNSGDTAVDDVARDKWIQVNIPAIDGNVDTWTPIGGTIGKDVRANAGVGEENVIKGIVNDGIAANSPENVSTINLRAVAPPNSDPGDKLFKVRLNGYYT
jgi:hypothetical protein